MAVTTTAVTTFKTTTVIVLVFVLACFSVSAKSPAPEAATAPSTVGNGCFTALINMSNCLTYVEDGSNLTKPGKGCCPELAGLVDSSPICLCQLLGNPEAAVGFKIDVNKALKLPSVCGVSTPPVSTCSAVGVPVSLPPSSTSPSGMPSKGPATSPSNSVAAPTDPGGMGSASSPSTDEATASPSGNKNKGTSIHASVLTFLFGLAAVSVSIFF